MYIYYIEHKLFTLFTAFVNHSSAYELSVNSFSLNPSRNCSQLFTAYNGPSFNTSDRIQNHGETLMDEQTILKERAEAMREVARLARVNAQLLSQLAATEEALKQVQRESKELRTRHKELHDDYQRIEENSLTACEYLRQSFLPNGIDSAVSIVGLANLAKDRIRQLEEDNDTLVRDRAAARSERAKVQRESQLLREEHSRDCQTLREWIATRVDYPAGVRLVEGVIRYAERLEAARKVADAALHYFDVDDGNVEWDALAFNAFDDAVREYRAFTSPPALSPRVAAAVERGIEEAGRIGEMWETN